MDDGAEGRRANVAARLEADLRTRFPSVTVSWVWADDMHVCEVVDGGLPWGHVGSDSWDEDDGSVEELLVEVTWYVCENLWPDELTDPWPLCGMHRDHPLQPHLLRGRACWMCERDASTSVEIGSLASY